MRRKQLVLRSLLGLALFASLPAARADSGRVRAQDLAARVSVQGRPAEGYSAKVVFNSSRGLQERYPEHAPSQTERVERSTTGCTSGSSFGSSAGTRATRRPQLRRPALARLPSDA